jgi:hypothetical protein
MFSKFAGIGVLIAILIAGVLLIIRDSNKETPAQRDDVISISTVEPMVQNVGKSISPKAGDEQMGAGFAAIENAQKTDKYLFLYFYKFENENTSKMRTVFDSTMQKLSDRAESVKINITNPAERALLKKYGISGRSPLPLVLTLAPNGAITGGFPGVFNAKQLMGAFGTPCLELCLKALQNQKLVFVCIQNPSTKNNTSALAGVREFKADKRFSQATEIVTLDPSEESELKFLKQLQINPKLVDATTILLAPPGVAVAKIAGATDKKQFVSAVQTAVAGCGPKGCGPKGCGPAGCGPKK